MTAINVTVVQDAAWLSADGAVSAEAPAGMVTPQLSSDVEAIRRGTFATTLGPAPRVSYYARKLVRLGRRMVVTSTGHLWPLLELGSLLEEAAWGLDEAVARAPGELQRIVAESALEAAGAIVLAGWSDAEDRALAFALAMGGSVAQRLPDGHATMPLPDHRDPAYPELFALYSAPAGQHVEELHQALVLNQAAAARRGAYRVPIAIGGDVLMMRVTRHGVDERVLVNLDEQPLT